MSILRNLLGGGSANPPAAAQPNSKPLTPASHKQFGLENFGNTCYINAVFQALYFCGPFRDLVIATPDGSAPSTQPPTPVPVTALTSQQASKSTWNPRSAIKRRDSALTDPADSAAAASPTAPVIPTEPPSLFSALRSLFIHIAQNTQDTGKVPPTAFVKKIKDDNEAFRNNNHQDAHELFNFLLNRVVEDLEAQEKASKAKIHNDTMNGSAHQECKRTFIHDLFEGVLTSETRCLTCETVSSRDEAFLDLSIDIEPNSSVTSCLRQFSASEMLCQRNKFSCDSCSGLQEAERRMKVKKLPSILALHLKRFKYQEDVQRFIKLTYRVAFPLELRLFNTVDDADNADRLYELFAIVVHIGGGPHHGHYTSIVRSRGSWVVFDDDSVESIKESEIAKYFGDSNVGAGYVLFYQAADLNPPPPTSEKVATPEKPLSKETEPSPREPRVAFPISEHEEPPLEHPAQKQSHPTEPTPPAQAVPDPAKAHEAPQPSTKPKTSILTNGVASQLLGPSSAVTQDDHKRTWFGVGRSKSTKKQRPKDAPPPLQDTFSAPHHSRARTTGGVSEYDHHDSHNSTLENLTSSGTLNHAPQTLINGLRPSGNSAAEAEPSDSKRRNSSSSDSRPSTALTANSLPAISAGLGATNQTKESSTLQPQSSPTTEASPLEGSHTIGKKASRKMSLTAMPSRLTGFMGRKERDKDHG